MTRLKRRDNPYNKYKFKLKDNSKIEISFSANFDNIINKHKDGEFVEGVFLFDCSIVGSMSKIMRYCFEENVDLRKIRFLRNLPDTKPYVIDKNRALYDFKRRLRDDVGTIRKVNHDLVIHSFPTNLTGRISFCSEDVPKFVEGIIREFDYDGISGARRKVTQTVQYYHECLERGEIS